MLHVSSGTSFSVNRAGMDGQDEIVLALNLGGVEIPAALVDTGASCTLVSENLYELHKNRWGKLNKDQNYRLQSFDSRRIGIKGTLLLNMCVSDPDDPSITYTRRVEVLVTRDLGNHMLIGMDVLNQFFSSLVFKTGKLYIRPDITPDHVTLEIAARPELRTSLLVRKHVELPPGTTHAVEVEFDHLIATSPSDPLLFLQKPCYDKEGYPLDLAFPSTVISLEISKVKGQWRLAVANLSANTLVLPRGTEIGWVAIQPRGLPTEREFMEQTLPVEQFQLLRVNAINPEHPATLSYELQRKPFKQGGDGVNPTNSSAASRN